MAQRLDKDKMLAGEIFNCLDLALVAEREQAKLLLRQYNQSSDPAMQREIFQKLLGQLGEGSIIEPPFFCSYGRNLYLGNRVYLNFCCTILGNNEVWLVGPRRDVGTAGPGLYGRTLVGAGSPSGALGKCPTGDRRG